MLRVTSAQRGPLFISRGPPQERGIRFSEALQITPHKAREPHRIPTCLMETAAEFHRFYHVCRVVSEDRATTRWRLSLCEATRQVLANGLALMGVSAPERMERTAEAGA